jgi:hypothetical protein
MANGYPTYQDVKLYLSISSSVDDALIVATLKRAIATFENMCGRTFLPKEDTVYYSAKGENVIDRHYLHLRDADLLSITSLTIDGVSVPVDEYYTSGTLPKYAVRLHGESDFSFKEFSNYPEQSIVIEGIFGYDTEVPDDVFGAIIRLTAWLYQQKDNSMELDRPVAISNAMVLPMALPSDVEAIARFYKRLI